MDSGLAVSVLRGSTDIDMTIVGDQRFVAITVPGNPCGALLCCSDSGARALVTRLNEGLERLRTIQDPA
jgi:hypothetical protein